MTTNETIIDITVDAQGRLVVPELCPHCGEVPAEVLGLPYAITAWQWLNNETHIDVVDGRAVWTNEGNDDDQNLLTEHYTWSCCGVPLPEDVQAAIDRQLDNERRRVMEFGSGTDPVLHLIQCAIVETWREQRPEGFPDPALVEGLGEHLRARIVDEVARRIADEEQAP